MRFHHYLLLLGACLPMAFSCKEKPVEPEEEAPKIELPAQTQALLDQGIRFESGESGDTGTATLRFTANKPWSISVAAVAPSKALSWLSVSPESGPAGDAVVEVTAQPNPSTLARAAALILSCGELHLQFTITQEGKEDTPPPPPEPVAVKKVTLTPGSLELLVGDVVAISYAVEPENADIESVTWSSSDEAVAAVEPGKVTALAAGTAVISVKVNEVEAHCAVSVETPFVPVESITVSMTEVTLVEGSEYRLSATVLPENATDPSVSWSSSDETVATVEDGLVKALQEGSAVISARAGEKEAQCTVTVEKDFVPVSSVAIEPEMAQLLPGETVSLSVTVLPEDATDPSVSWSSSDENVAVVENGKVTAVSPGSAVITARAGEQEARCSILVDTPFVPVESITLSPSQVTLTEGDETSLTAIVLPENATDPHVSFESSNSAVAAVDQGGKITAVAPGTAVVTAKAGDCTATCEVIVEARTVPVESVSLNKSALTLDVGESYELKATVNPSNATDPSVTWSSSDPAVASVAEGHVEALQAGTAVIKASAGGKEASCTVTVNQPYVAVESISLSQTELTVAKDETVQLTAIVLPSNATDPSVTWTTANSRIAKVDAEGNVTGVRLGTTTITAKAGQYTATCTVTVTAPVESISLNYSQVTIRQYDSVQLRVITYPTGSVLSGTVVWTSDLPSVASVDENGLVKGLQAGAVTIKASADGMEASCTVIVSNTANGGNEGTGTEDWN